MTSWMSSRFASTQTSPLLPSNGHDSDLDNYGDESGTSAVSNRRKERNETLEEEEKARPPYLHVSNSSGEDRRIKFKHYGREADLTFFAVDDRRWYWWDYRGPTHAFNRYRQNTPTRRPEHSSEVYLSFLVIFENLSTRRPA